MKLSERQSLNRFEKNQTDSNHSGSAPNKVQVHSAGKIATSVFCHPKYFIIKLIKKIIGKLFV